MITLSIIQTALKFRWENSKNDFSIWRTVSGIKASVMLGNGILEKKSGSSLLLLMPVKENWYGRGD